MILIGERVMVQNFDKELLFCRHLKRKLEYLNFRTPLFGAKCIQELNKKSVKREGRETEIIGYVTSF